MKNFQAQGDGVTDDAPALQKVLDQAAQAGPGTVVLIPEGTYLLKTGIRKVFSSAQDGIELDDGVKIPTASYALNLKGVTIRGQGKVQLLATNWEQPALAMVTCSGCTVENLTISFQTAPFARLRVLKINAKNNTLDVEQLPDSTLLMQVFSACR